VQALKYSNQRRTGQIIYAHKCFCWRHTWTTEEPWRKFKEKEGQSSQVGGASNRPLCKAVLIQKRHLNGNYQLEHLTPQVLSDRSEKKILVKFSETKIN